MKPTAIYALVDPVTDQIRYIGQSTNTARRFQMHKAPSRTARKTPKDVWIAGLIAADLKPRMEILEIVENEALSREREAYWICHARNSGCNLTNLSGGIGLTGMRHTAETRAKIGRAHRGMRKPRKQVSLFVDENSAQPVTFDTEN